MRPPPKNITLRQVAQVVPDAITITDPVVLLGYQPWQWRELERLHLVGNRCGLGLVLLALLGVIHKRAIASAKAKHAIKKPLVKIVNI